MFSRIVYPKDWGLGEKISQTILGLVVLVLSAFSIFVFPIWIIFLAKEKFWPNQEWEWTKNELLFTLGSIQTQLIFVLMEAVKGWRDD